MHRVREVFGRTDAERSLKFPRGRENGTMIVSGQAGVRVILDPLGRLAGCGFGLDFVVTAAVGVPMVGDESRTMGELLVLRAPGVLDLRKVQEWHQLPEGQQESQQSGQRALPR